MLSRTVILPRSYDRGYFTIVCGSRGGPSAPAGNRSARQSVLRARGADAPPLAAHLDGRKRAQDHVEPLPFSEARLDIAETHEHAMQFSAHRERREQKIPNAIPRKRLVDQPMHIVVIDSENAHHPIRFKGSGAFGARGVGLTHHATPQAE